ncbi:hypothetical protein [Acinetobacter higginsii]|uniref:hypothetical protein n=1 Tax=Acinetobacter higginsii TaxID=70347 RepID=UPI001F60C961|nr:hypothetical protein [Acinetobacter higginsii]MCI3881260.1 hypothetical protein [Acinetobacter higginsii]
MTEDELLERALHYSATIHQPHAIKTYQAAKNIFTVLGNNAIWEQADKLIFQSEIYNVRSFTQDSHDTKFSLPGEFKHEVRQFEKSYDNQQAEQISLMV